MACFNADIDRKVKIILAMPEPPKKVILTRKQMIVQNAIIILNRFEQKIDQAIQYNR